MFFSYVKNKNEVTDLSRGEESRIFRPVFFFRMAKKGRLLGQQENVMKSTFSWEVSGGHSLGGVVCLPWYFTTIRPTTIGEDIFVGTFSKHRTSKSKKMVVNLLDDNRYLQKIKNLLVF